MYEKIHIQINSGELKNIKFGNLKLESREKELIKYYNQTPAKEIMSSYLLSYSLFPQPNGS